MNPPFVFDTSALFAHCLEEPGCQIVEDILERHPNKIHISAITWLEFQVRLEEILPDPGSRREIVANYAELLADPLPVTKDIVRAALDLREQTGQRLPNADAIIAATARAQSATLVHRDPHLTPIPEHLVRQIVLPPKSKGPQPKKH